MRTAVTPAVWFPAVRAETGTDVFTRQLLDGLRKQGVRAEITWLPKHAEYAPWTVPAPKAPAWANIVHVNTWLHPRFIPKDLPVVATLHHAVHHPDLEPYKGWLRAAYHRHWIRRIERATMRRADRVIAVSHFAAETARATLLGLPMDVIPNGVDVNRFRPPTQRVTHRPFRLLYIGSWMARKGVDLLAPIMRALGNDFELRYTGGPKADKDSAAMPCNAHNIGRLTATDEVVAEMQEADAFLFPSRSEGFGLVIAEAMACGLPVIATRGSSLTDVVEDGVTGILCQKDDIAAFAAAARELASYPGVAAGMSKAGRNLSLARFSALGTVDAYFQLYGSISVPDIDHGYDRSV